MASRGRLRRWLVGILAMALWPAAAGASDTGLAVSPAFAEVKVASGAPSAGYTLQIVNHNPVDQNFVLSVVDFGALDESGGVAFLGAPASELEHKYGLASWLSVEKNTVFVAAGQTVAVKVSVDNRESLAPGGHYGAVLATAVNEPGTPASARVGVKQVLSSLVLVTKDGGANADLRLVSQEAPGSWWSLPNTVTQRFQNTGNIHVVPRGVIELKDPAGRVVKRAAINDGSQMILPESFRQYKSSLLNLKAAVLPGRYTLVSTYRYDGIESTAKLETSFWYAGKIVVWIVGLGALVTTLGLAWWLWIRPRRKKR